MKNVYVFWRLAPALLLGLAGCGGRQIVRSNYELAHYDALVVSDSATEISSLRKLGDQKIQVGQSILVKNTADRRSYSLRLDHAAFRVAGETFPSSCKRADVAPKGNTIHPGETVRIDCKTVVTADATNHLAIKDTTGTLGIPLDDATAGPMLFKYRLAIEDFE